MCGPENTNRPRGGALAALGPATSLKTLCGDLAFHTPGCPGSITATHARLTPSEACNMDDLSDLHVVIHSSGDMTRSAQDCGLFRRFALAGVAERGYLELPLDKPLSLEVGADGIIGRRVSVFSSQDVLAEGIVGFNFVNPST